MSSTEKTVSIDFCPQSALRYVDHDAIVCLDVIRATTTLVAAVATGRRVFAAADFAEASRIARDLKQPLLAGADPRLPPGSYEIPNSPHAISTRKDIWRPLVLVSSYGTRLLANARGCRSVFVASLQNIRATAEALAAGGFHRVALLGAGSFAGLRCEDQIAAARLGALLRARGFEAGTRGTTIAMDCWGEVDTDLIRLGRSAERLVQTGQKVDLDFILAHVDDLDLACEIRDSEVHRLGDGEASESTTAAPAVEPTADMWRHAFYARDDQFATS
jgi:2-phosphosulfolactate phosphatase